MKIGVGTFKTSLVISRLVNEVLDSGRISYGPKSKTLERQFSALHGCDFGVLSNSGTASLQIALQALKELHGWQDGDEVIVPAITFVATVNVVIHNNLIPVLVDVDSNYYGIDVEKIEAAITPDTRAIIPVHMFGQPCDMRGVSAIAEKHDLVVIEDSCEAMFVNCGGMPVGGMGDIGCFSMYVAHLLTAGVGGIATTNNGDYAAKMRSLVNHGRDGIYISIDDSGEEVVERRFRFESIGHSARITELEAAVALGQLHSVRDSIAIRQRNAEVLTRALGDVDFLQLPKIRMGAEHAFMMYPIILRSGDKWDLCNYLEAAGIETREMMPLTRQPCYSGLWGPDDYPVADWINRGGFYVGCHQDLFEDDMLHIAKTIKAWRDD